MPKTQWSDFVGERRVRVAGSRGAEYVVTFLGTMPKWCTCPSFEHRAGPRGEFCKHMKARHGSQAIGRTRCASCHSFLTPEDITTAVDQGIPEPQRCCPECTPAQVQ